MPINTFAGDRPVMTPNASFETNREPPVSCTAAIPVPCGPWRIGAVTQHRDAGPFANLFNSL